VWAATHSFISVVVTGIGNHAIQSTFRMESKTSKVYIYGNGRIGGKEIHSDSLLVNDQIILTQLYIKATYV